ncbi:MAG TPA: IclR family transcriptional regulator [Bacillota bacterium]|nr:IclR family transcriptional regulator [Bacillota bacterium]
MLKTLTLALDVLKMFTKEKQTWGGRELANELQLNHARIYRVLETLTTNGFLKKNPETKKYSLGFAIWELGTIMYDGLNVRQLIKPELERLCSKTGESVFLTILDGNEGVTLEVAEPENKVKFTVTKGSRAPLYVGASYRAILAYADEALIHSVIHDEPLVKYTNNTIASPSELEKELKIIHRNGWSLSISEYSKDIVAMAAPIFRNNEVIGSITLSGPTYRMPDERVNEYLPLLMESRDKIEKVIIDYDLQLTE